MHRPIWKGFISFGLAYIPITLYTAEKRNNISFHLVDSRDHARIKYQRINEETGEEVPWDKVAKSYEYEKGNYLFLEETDLKKIAKKTEKNIDVVGFVNVAEIDPVYFEKPYYLIPEKVGKKGYFLFQQALIAAKKIAVAQVIIREKQYLAAIAPYETILSLILLRYTDEIAPIKEFDTEDLLSETPKIAKADIELAEKLITQMHVKWDPEKFHNDYNLALKKIIDKKIGEEKPKKMPRGAKKDKDNTIDFISAIKKSLEKKHAKRG